MSEKNYPETVFTIDGEEFCVSMNLDSAREAATDYAEVETTNWFKTVLKRLEEDPQFRTQVALFLTFCNPERFMYSEKSPFNNEPATNNLSFFTGLKRPPITRTRISSIRGDVSGEIQERLISQVIGSSEASE